MKKPRWRSYPSPKLQFGELKLEANGVVGIEKARFRIDDDIHITVDGAYRVIRPAGPGQFLVVERGGAMPMVFTFENGTWMRWIRLYRVGQWRLWCHDVVRTWGVGSPLIFASWIVYVWTAIRGLFLLLSARLLVMLGTAILLTLVIRFWTLHRRERRLLTDSEGMHTVAESRP